MAIYTGKSMSQVFNIIKNFEETDRKRGEDKIKSLSVPKMDGLLHYET